MTPPPPPIQASVMAVKPDLTKKQKLYSKLYYDLVYIIILERVKTLPSHSTQPAWAEVISYMSTITLPLSFLYGIP
jgi:hypothetical protein